MLYYFVSTVFRLFILDECNTEEICAIANCPAAKAGILCPNKCGKQVGYVPFNMCVCD